MAQYNRVRVLISAGGTGTLTVGATDTDCNPITSYAGASGIPYLLTWSGGYEIGSGSLAGTTFSRDHIFENSLDDTAAQSVPVGALLSITPLAQLGISSGVLSGSNAPPIASGVDAFAVGPGTSVIGDNGTAVGPGASAGIAGLAVGPGATALRGGELTVGVTGMQQHYQNFHVYTSDATPVVATPDYGDTTPHTITSGQVWLVTATVLVVQFDGSYLGATKAKAITLSVLADYNGPVVAAASPVVLYNLGSLGATATIGVTGGGNVEVTLTGVAATDLAWRVSLEIKKLFG